MLPVSRLLTSIRYSLRDMQGTSFSDFEIVEALNRAAGLLFGRMGEKFVWPALKRTVIVTDHGEAKLPADFHSVRKVSCDGGEAEPVTRRPGDGQYRIAGDALFAQDGAYGLEYWYLPPPVRGLDDVLDAPLAVSPYLERCALALLNGDEQGAEATVQACCHALAAGDLSAFSDMGPVRIWGGKA